MELSNEIYDLLPRNCEDLREAILKQLSKTQLAERQACADIALAIDSGRGNEK